MSVAAAGLPNGWQMGWSVTFRRAYFYHEAMGLSQWEDPTAAPPPSTGAGVAKASSGWQADALVWREQQRLEAWARERAASHEQAHPPKEEPRVMSEAERRQAVLRVRSVWQQLDQEARAELKAMATRRGLDRAGERAAAGP
mmetsp:Transcript_6138/g.13585  ORF Transcript_6138/g.13585 Transcript_6138/m.13585 type:complete len:142 (+) Transcript_6138:3-428(+)